MEKIASCNFTKYIQRGPNRWQHCPVVRGKTGRVKQDLVLVAGRIEHHPEGYYSLDWREGGRRHRLALGKDASSAQLALERHVATQRARAIGIAVSEDRCAASLVVEEACEEYLDETRLQRSPKTLKKPAWLGPSHRVRQFLAPAFVGRKHREKARQTNGA
jgi:hypothetical protein